MSGAQKKSPGILNVSYTYHCIHFQFLYTFYFKWAGSPKFPKRCRCSWLLPSIKQRIQRKVCLLGVAAKCLRKAPEIQLFLTDNRLIPSTADCQNILVYSSFVWSCYLIRGHCLPIEARSLQILRPCTQRLTRKVAWKFFHEKSYL